MSGKGKRKNKKPGSSRPNFWGMIQTITIAAINKGQFILAIIAAIIIIILLKMPGEDVSRLVFEILKQFVNASLLGWGLFIFSIIGWYHTARYLRRHHTKEIRRISEEKTKYQRNWLGDLESSNQ